MDPDIGLSLGRSSPRSVPRLRRQPFHLAHPNSQELSGSPAILGLLDLQREVLLSKALQNPKQGRKMQVCFLFGRNETVLMRSKAQCPRKLFRLTVEYSKGRIRFAICAIVGAEGKLNMSTVKRQEVPARSWEMGMSMNSAHECHRQRLLFRLGQYDFHYPKRRIWSRLDLNSAQSGSRLRWYMRSKTTEEPLRHPVRIKGMFGGHHQRI